MIPSNQLLAADNLVFKVSGSRLMRDGINHNWDSATAGTGNAGGGGAAGIIIVVEEFYQ